MTGTNRCNLRSQHLYKYGQMVTFVCRKGLQMIVGGSLTPVKDRGETEKKRLVQ